MTSESSAHICPECKSKNVLKTLYGLPNEEGIKAEREGKVVLRGCIIMEDSREWICGDCSHEFGKRVR